MAEVLCSRRSEGPSFHAPIRSTSSASLCADSYALRRNPTSLPDLRAPSLSSAHTASRNLGSTSRAAAFDAHTDDSSSDDEGMSFSARKSRPQQTKPAYSHQVDPLTIPPDPRHLQPLPSPVLTEETVSDTPLTTPDPLPISEDDTAVRKEPSHHVDYLSYEWREEDIWSSWRHIVEHRNVYGERSRLENASWRTWAKSQFKLKTVSPDTLNWLKDVDVTWLYGPLQPASNRFFSQQNSEPASRLSKTNSFVHGVKKPILKKRSMSEAMLQQSLSSSSLVKQAAESVQAQQNTGATLDPRRPRLISFRKGSDFPTPSVPSRAEFWEPVDYFSSKSTSGLQTPDQGEKKHIRFDDNVEQCIAVDCKDADDDEEDFNHNPWAKYSEDDSSSDEGVVMMKRSRRKKPLSRTSSKTSISGDNKTIAPLPSTTLKYRTDSPDVTEQSASHSLGLWRSSRLSPSPSQETLRPSNPSMNFLLPEDDDDSDYIGSPGEHRVNRPGTPTTSHPHSHRSSSPSSSSGLRRTESGMFMPFGDNDDEPPPPGFIGRVVDTVNTARDIAHVIWNVGWKN